MLRINDMPAPVEPTLLDRLRQVEPATLGHFLDAGFMDPDLRCVIPDGGICAGTAVTLRLPGLDSALEQIAIDHARPGDFLVIDRCGDHTAAAWGGVMAVAAARARIAGVIVDGRVCDFREIRQSGVNVWCRGPTPVTCRKIGKTGELNGTVSCGNVAVSPGDAIVADDSGIFVLPQAGLASIVQRALAMQERERTIIMPRLRAGEPLSEITGVAALIEAALQSQKA